MNINVNDLIITSLETIMAFDPITGSFRFSLDELQDTTISQTQDTVDITGKQGRKLSTLKRNKAVTIKGTSGLVSGGLFELQTGSKFEAKDTTVKWNGDMALVVNGGTATTTFTAVGVTGNEIGELYVNSNSVLTTKFTQGAAAAPGIFTYNPATKIIEFYSGELDDGTEIAVFYDRKISANTLINPSDKYSDKCSLYIDAIGEDTCANQFRVQFYIPKADFSGNFDIAMGGDQVVQAFEASALAGSCGTAGNYYDMVIYGAGSEDVV